MSAVTPVADVLNGAADLIERDGWVQHDYRGPNGERCLTRAIADVIGDARPWDSPKYAEAAKALEEVTGTFLVAGYNDWPQRTKAEVVAALHAAAERAAA